MKIKNVINKEESGLYETKEVSFTYNMLYNKYSYDASY